MAEQLKDWYPSANQLTDPAKLEQAFREVLRLHYSERGRVDGLHAKVNTPAKLVPPPSQSQTASITNILGLPIFPSDTTQLADGTKLTWVAASKRFEFLP